MCTPCWPRRTDDEPSKDHDAAPDGRGLIPLPFVGVPLSFVALAAGIVHLRTARRERRQAWAAVVIAIATLAAALVLALTMLATGPDPAPKPGPVQTVS